MAMWNNNDSRLPDWVIDAYEAIEPHFAEKNGLAHDEVLEIIVEDAETVDSPTDAEYAIERLLQRGWLYEVQDKLRKTD